MNKPPLPGSTTSPFLAKFASAGQPSCIFIPTLGAGGAERVASQLANAWCGSRRVAVITYFDEPHFFPLDPRVEVHCLGMRAFRGGFGRSADLVRAAMSFRRVVQRLRPTFVLSFMNKYNAFSLAALRGTGIPVIVSERDSPTEILPRIRVMARDLLYPAAAGLICQTEAGREFMTARTAIRRAIVIPNPVKPIIAPTEREGERIVLGVGRFVPKKAFDQLIEAFAVMKAKDWRLILCGDGPMRPELEARVKTLGIAERVEFAGLVNDLRPYYRRASLFAFSSLHEGYPNALAEAMVSGLPCVSYDCPTGPSDIINSGDNGLLVEVGDVAGMTAGLDRLAADPGLARRLGERAAGLARELDPARISDRFLEFCELAAEAEAAR